MFLLFCALTLALLSISLSATVTIAADLTAMCNAVSPSLRSDARLTSAEFSRRNSEANSSPAKQATPSC